MLYWWEIGNKTRADRPLTKLISCSLKFSSSEKGIISAVNHVSECIYFIRKALDSFRPGGTHPGSLFSLLREPPPRALLNPSLGFPACSTRGCKRCCVLRLFFTVKSDFSKMYFGVHYGLYPFLCVLIFPQSEFLRLLCLSGPCLRRHLIILQLPDTPAIL